MLRRIRRTVKKLLAVGWIRRTYDGANRAIGETFGSNRVLAHLFYAGYFITFNREQAAVLRGRRNYYRNKLRERPTHVGLRRNIHRLEKGLVMRPRREVFARDYIAETIEFYDVAARQYAADPASMDASEIEWAHDVLAEYFRACTGPHPLIDAARERFAGIPAPGEPGTKVPYVKVEGPRADITYEQLATLSMQRRSTRWFDQRPVPRELVDQALLVARQAPTACNRLPYEFLIFDDPELVAKVAGLPFGAAGYSHNIPTIVVLVGKLENYFSPRDRHVIYVDSSLAAMSFMFALETLGLSSSVINWPDFEPLERQMQKTLGLDIADRVVMLIAVGYAHPEGMVPYSQKKELDTFRFYNRVP